MKRIAIRITAILSAILLASWGFLGHKTIGQIAETHLTPQAKASVQALLGNQNLADVASWADEVRGSDPAYRRTASWHFINVPPGLTFEQFKDQVSNSDKPNVYTALLDQENILKNPASTADQKIVALKFIVHFVGDIHQPMHVSRAEDKGGNTIQVNFLGHSTNLHSLWDTGLLEHDANDAATLAAKYDHPTEAQIKKWQNDPQIRWAWESYQISGKLYEDIDAMNSRSLDESYYNDHISIVRQRIEQAGIRLAGLLNTLFAQAPVTGRAAVTTGPATSSSTPKTINVKDAASHYNETVTVTAQVYGTRDFGSMVLVNLGAAYPNSLLTVVLRGDAKSLGQNLDGKTITVTGQIIQYKDKPEITVNSPVALKVN